MDGRITLPMVLPGRLLFTETLKYLPSGAKKIRNLGDYPCAVFHKDGVSLGFLMGGSFHGHIVRLSDIVYVCLMMFLLGPFLLKK
ncbi:MAG: hypothetical protein KC736_03280 [Candidatus Moranbacteria bacterium]|nr:hypothetical protein [Candidatus Moranbacteria bacterium]